MSIFTFIFGITAAAAAALAARHQCMKFVGFDLQAPKGDEREAASGERKSPLETVRELGVLLGGSREQERKTREGLIQAGMKIDAFTWMGMQIVSIAVFGFSGVLLAVVLNLSSGTSFALIFLGFLAGYATPRLYVSSKKRKRQREIEAALPSALELLSTAVHAGYPLERGIRLVGTSTEGALAEEFSRVDWETNRLNMPLDKSLERLKVRCDTQSVSHFVNAMVQSYRQGTSIARSLETQAQAARDQYYSDILVKINQLPNKMVPVIFIVFFPIIIVLSIVPVAYNALIQFSSLM